MAKTSTNKETIYIDVDDEITNIIDKVKSSKHKIIALVLPKRASVLQSVVNMKLLKKAAVNAKKSLVLITSETSLLPLAGVAGLHVAKSLQSKPAIPPSPHRPDEDSETPEVIGDEEPALDTSASIGALSTAAAADADDTETIELDNINIEEPAKALTAKDKFKKLKHLKVPNFEKFRLGFFLAGLGLLLLIGGWFMAFVVMPKANITIKTDTTTVVSSFDYTASTNQEELDIEDKKIPATLKEVKKSDSEKVPATGERDDGTKAEGEVTLKLTNCSEDEVTVPAGTTVSTGGLNYVTQKAAKMESVKFGGNCNNDALPSVSSETVEVVSAQNGDSYNIGSGKTFTVSGHSNVAGTNSDGFGGGTSKIVKVVSQKDIDDAMSKMKARLDKQAEEELQAVLETEGLYALTETRTSGEPTITAVPELDKEATDVIVSSETTYSMLGITKDHLSQIIKDDVKADIDTEKQAITDDGIDESNMNINNQPTPGEAFISFRTSVTAGPEINEDAIKELARGKKRGEIEQQVGGLPGVDEVIVDYSPFWVYSTPKAAKKITVTVEKTTDSTQESEANGSE